MRRNLINAILGLSVLVTTAACGGNAPLGEEAQASELAAADPTVNALSALLMNPKLVEQRTIDTLAYIQFSREDIVHLYALRKEGADPIETTVETDEFLVVTSEAVFLIDTKRGTAAGATFDGLDSAPRIREHARRFGQGRLSDLSSGAALPKTLEAVQKSLNALGNAAAPIERAGRATDAPANATDLLANVAYATFRDGKTKVIGVATGATAPTAKLTLDQKIVDRLARRTREGVLVGKQALSALRKKSDVKRMWLLGGVEVSRQREFTPYLEKASATHDVVFVSDDSTVGAPVEESRLPKVSTVIASAAEDAWHVNPNAVGTRGIIAGRCSTDLRMNVLLPNVDELIVRAWVADSSAPEELSWVVRAVQDFKLPLTIIAVQSGIEQRVKTTLEQAGIRSFSKVQFVDDTGEVTPEWKELTRR